MATSAPAPALMAVDREQLLVELVDQAGRPVGSCPVHQAHTAPGQLHRAFSVLLYDPSGRVLLQRRAAAKTRFALRWSNTCCGHPAPGQDPAVAARIRLTQELGISPAQLTPLVEAGVFTYRAGDAATERVEHEWDHVFVATLVHGASHHGASHHGASHHRALSPDASEVCAVRWANPGALAAEIDARPADFTPWLAGVLGLAVTVPPEGTR